MTAFGSNFKRVLKVEGRTAMLTLRENFWFVCFTGMFVGLAALLGFIYKRMDLLKFDLYSKAFYEGIWPVALVLFALYLARITFFADTVSLAGKIRSDIRVHVINARNIFSILLVMLALPLMGSSLTIIKTLLPSIVPYYLDPSLMELDRNLHFGMAPWEIIQPIVGYPYITFAINVVYNFWFFIQLFVLFWQMLSLNRPRLRMQFMVSYVLAWLVLGSLLAILLASAGPVFYARITGLADPYAPLFQYLHSANSVLAEQGLSIWALDTQNYLWAHYLNPKVGLGDGLSAMPSLHVSIAILLALVGWRVNNVLGLFFSLYAFAILLGSVHLGWHYAVDGYVSIMATIVIWKFAGLLVRNLPASLNREENAITATNPIGG